MYDATWSTVESICIVWKMTGKSCTYTLTLPPSQWMMYQMFSGSTQPPQIMIGYNFLRTSAPWNRPDYGMVRVSSIGHHCVQESKTLEKPTCSTKKHEAGMDLLTDCPSHSVFELTRYRKLSSETRFMFQIYLQTCQTSMLIRYKSPWNTSILPHSQTNDATMSI